jgi:hypothetical protein
VCLCWVWGPGFRLFDCGAALQASPASSSTNEDTTTVVAVCKRQIELHPISNLELTATMLSNGHLLDLLKSVKTSGRTLHLDIGIGLAVTIESAWDALIDLGPQVMTFGRVPLKTSGDIEKFTAAALAFTNMRRIMFGMYKSLAKANKNQLQKLKAAYKRAKILAEFRVVSD